VDVVLRIFERAADVSGGNLCAVSLQWVVCALSGTTGSPPEVCGSKTISENSGGTESDVSLRRKKLAVTEISREQKPALL
jgi:hypothetical protein